MDKDIKYIYLKHTTTSMGELFTVIGKNCNFVYAKH